jgi:hypothetical protein
MMGKGDWFERDAGKTDGERIGRCERKWNGGNERIEVGGIERVRKREFGDLAGVEGINEERTGIGACFRKDADA